MNAFVANRAALICSHLPAAPFSKSETIAAALLENPSETLLAALLEHHLTNDVVASAEVLKERSVSIMVDVELPIARRVVEPSGLNVRALPDAGSDKLAVIRKGQEVHIWYDHKNGWSVVTFEETDQEWQGGWCASRFLRNLTQSGISAIIHGRE